MKRMFLAVLLIACVSIALADVYTIGTGTSTQNYVPFYGLYDYGWSKTIYTAAEINTAGLTTASSLVGIGFEVGNTPSNYTMLDQRVYLRTTTQSVYEVADNLIPDNTLFTSVYQGSLTYNGGGWQYVMFSTPFAWDGTSNIEVLWENWDGDYVSGYPNFRYTTTTPDYRSVYKYADTTFPATLTGTRYYNRPNIQFATPQTTPPNPAVAIYPTMNGYAFTDASLSWQNGGGMPSSNDVYFGTDNPPMTLVSNDQVTTSYTPAAALLPGTTYYWQIIPSNSNGPATGCPVWSFNTPGTEQLAESFNETTWPPAGWANPGTFTRSTTTPFHGLASAYKSSPVTPALLSTPMLSITASSSLNFWARTSATTGNGRIQIQYSPDRVTWTNVGTEIALPTTTNWNNFSIDLSSLSGNNYYLAFAASSVTSTTAIYIDHVFGPNVTPLIPGPVTLTAPVDAAINQSAMPTLTWAPGATDRVATTYKVYLDTNAAPTTLIATVPTTTYTIATMLVYNATYYWKVVAGNSAGDAEASPVFSFTVMDNPTITTLPWTVSFGTVAADWPVLNWSQLNGLYGGPTTTGAQWFQDDWLNDATTGNKAAKINIYGTNRYGWLVTPPIAIPTTGYQLKFDAAFMVWNGTTPPTTTQDDDRFLVVMSDSPLMTNPTIIREWNNTGSPYVLNSVPATGTNVSIPLGNIVGTKYFAFYGESTVTGNGDNDFMIDNLTIFGNGSLSGTVYGPNNIPLEGAIVMEPDSNFAYTTDITGTYNFPSILGGVHQVIATKHSYNTVISNVNILVDQNTSLNFALALLPQVTVAGMVVGSDQPTFGLASATINLEGYESYTTTTTVNGLFSIPNVFGSKTYDYTVTYAGYSSTTGTVVVGTTNLNMGTITVNEIALPATQVVANEAANFSNVVVTWSEPGTAGGEWLNYCGENEHGVGTGSVADFDVAIRFPAAALTDYAGMSLYSVKVWPVEAGSFSLRVWTGGTSTAPEAMVVDQAFTPLLNQYNEIALATPVLIPSGQELWFGYRCNVTSGYPAGCDAGPQDEGLGNMMYFQGAWTTLAALAPTLTFNWNIEGYVGYNAPTRGAELVPLVFNAERFNTGTLGLSGIKNNSTIAKPENNDRVHTGYEVWRLPQGQENNETEWMLLNPSLITDTSWLDIGWTDVTDGVYRWAVKALYSSGIASYPRFSNSIFRLRPPVVENQIPDLVINMNGSNSIAPVSTFFSSSDNDLHYAVEGNQFVTFGFLPDGQMQLTPSTNWYGVENLLIKAVDSKGQSAEQTIKITVLETWETSEDFNHVGNIPSNWSVTHSGSTTYPWQPYLIDSIDYGMKTIATLGNTAQERLVSTAYNLSNYENIVVSYATDFMPYANGSATFAYSFNNILYTTVETMNTSYSGLKTYNLPALAKKPTVYMRWTYTNSTANTGQENYWILDNLSISGLVDDTTPPTPLSGFAVNAVAPGSVTFGWEPVSEVYFSRYEIYVSTDIQVTTADQVWSENEDPGMAILSSSQTIVTGLTDGHYWAAIRAVDHSNNASSLSPVISFIVDSFAPLLIQPIPADQPLPGWSNTRIVTIGCTVEDNYDLDQNSLQFRYDQNQNGIYDPEELWQNFSGRSRSVDRNSQIVIQQALELPADGIYRFEIKASSLSGLITYSGDESIQGISDDWIVRVDTAPPTEISVFFVESVGDNSVQLTWSASSDQNFAGYLVFYGSHPGITSEDQLWDSSCDPLLQYEGSGLVSTNITGLIPSTRYYFRLYATDEFGWTSAFPSEITAMTSSSAPPMTPQNVIVSILGNQLIIDWDDVSTDTYGNPIGISYYSLYVGDQPYFVCGDESLLSTTTESYLALDNVLEYVDRIFFKIVAVSGTIRNRIPVSK